MTEAELPITEFTPGNETARAQLDRRIAELELAAQTAYGLLWMSRTSNPLVHTARRTLLACMNKGQQAQAIELARQHPNASGDA